MMIAVVEIRYLLLDGNWKAMTLQEVFGMVCTWHFSTHRQRKSFQVLFIDLSCAKKKMSIIENCARVLCKEKLRVITSFYGCVYILQRTLLLSLKHHIFVVLWLLPPLCHLMTF